MEETAFGAGGFREAFKATSKHKEYSYTAWVVKHYLDQSGSQPELDLWFPVI